MKLDNAWKAIFGGFGLAFTLPAVRRIAGLLFALLTLSTLFYHWVEDWRIVDAAYFSVVTVATVGYGDFAPATDAGKIFTIFLILSGIGLFVAMASAIAKVMVDGARTRDEDQRLRNGSRHKLPSVHLDHLADDVRRKNTRGEK